MDHSLQEYLDSLFTPKQQADVQRILSRAFGEAKVREIGEEPIIHIWGPGTSGKGTLMKIIERAVCSSQGVLDCTHLDVNSMMLQSDKFDGKTLPNFLNFLTANGNQPEGVHCYQKYWDWLIELGHKCESDEEEVSMSVITKGNYRRLTNWSDSNQNKERFRFEYKNTCGGKWSYSCCDCLKARDTEIERNNHQYETTLICHCRRHPETYERRLVDDYPDHKNGSVIFYPYFNGGQYSAKFTPTLIRDVVGTITIGTTPLKAKRVENIQLTTVFSEENGNKTLYLNLNQYGCQMREWILQYAEVTAVDTRNKSSAVKRQDSGVKLGVKVDSEPELTLAERLDMIARDIAVYKEHLRTREIEIKTRKIEMRQLNEKLTTLESDLEMLKTSEKMLEERDMQNDACEEEIARREITVQRELRNMLIKMEY